MDQVQGTESGSSLEWGMGAPVLTVLDPGTQQVLGEHLEVLTYLTSFNLDFLVWIKVHHLKEALREPRISCA